MKTRALATALRAGRAGLLGLVLLLGVPGVAAPATFLVNRPGFPGDSNP
ncbi:MAG: hypothetical protein U0610_13345 [bacterium]